MYPLPDNFDNMLLSECYLEMVCFGIHITRLDFSRAQMSPGVAPYKVSICVEAGLKYQVNDIWGERFFSKSTSSAPLLDLLLKDVVSVEKIGTSSLRILFESGEIILLESDNHSDYESYSIYLDSGDIIIV